MIKNIVFDFGMVLVNYDFQQFLNKLFESREELERFANVVLSKHWNSLLDKEDKPFGEYIEDLKQLYPQYAAQFDAFNHRFSEIILGEVPGMYDVLADLKQRGYKLYGLTNWSSKVYETINRFEIFKLLEGQVISSEEHLLKPYPEIYQVLLNRFHLKPEETLFTDDREENVVGGQAVGIDGIVFQNAQQFSRELEKKLKRK